MIPSSGIVCEYLEGFIGGFQLLLLSLVYRHTKQGQFGNILSQNSIKQKPSLAVNAQNKSK